MKPFHFSKLNILFEDTFLKKKTKKNNSKSCFTWNEKRTFYYYFIVRVPASPL